MKLKKIIIQGFKSFADRTEINFKDGVTAIVGPNGSGKSNISDAVRWVLGEQSVKTLRGAKMEDVIFAGTDKRKALGYAEVTIVFNNEMGKIPIEYKEVAITRRMFRSGESEYYLNKNSCRLKDIRELFMDTGVGKDGYSIIGQGRIDEILSNRPEDRRSIFEEAAGIVKYKSKKQEAEKKLEKTKENNNRIEDLIFELENRSDSLSLDSKRAKEYQDKFSKLKKLETSLYYSEIKKSEIEIETLVIEKDRLFKEYQKHSLNKENVYMKFDSSKETMEKNNLELEEARNQRDLLMEELDRKNKKVLILTEKENYSNKELERLEKDRKNYLEEVGSLGREIISFEENLEKLKSDYISSNELYENKGTEVDNKVAEVQKMEEALEIEKNDLINTYNKISGLKSNLNSSKTFKDNISSRLDKLNKDIEKILLKRNEMNCKNLEIMKSKEGLEEKREILLKDYAFEKEENEKLLKEIEALEIDLNQKKSNFNKDVSSLSILKNMEESFEGYYRGVRAILKEADKNSKFKEGFLGVVADIFKVDDRFEIAIETALGSSVQNIVVEDEETGKKIIGYLKENKLGRVTCLPLNTIRGRKLELEDSYYEKYGILGLASDLIKFEERFSDIFISLLGRTLVINNIDNAIEFSRFTKQKYRIVTLDGSIINPGGSMTGGSRVGGNTGIIGRKNRIDELELSINKVEKEIVDNESCVKEKKAYLSKVNDNLIKIMEKIKSNEYSTIELKNEAFNIDRELERIDESLEEREKEKVLLNEDLSKQLLDISSFTEEITIVELNIENKNKKIEKISLELERVKKINEEKLKKYTDFKINLNEKRNKISNLKETLALKESEIKLKKEKIAELDLEIVNIKDSNLDIKRQLNELNLEISKLVKKEEKSKEELDGMNLSNREFLEGFYLLQKNLNDINDLALASENNLRKVELEIDKLRLVKENNIKKLLEEYDIEYANSNLKPLEDHIDISEYKKEVSLLKRQIKELGNINLASIEDFEIVNERLTFMKEQRDDLNKAKKDLDRVIFDMEKKMKSQFKECFEKVNKNFEEIFKVLFKGGSAELILENPEDILGTGIDIKAQPPGKKQQSLSLLSGGERSLTAVALLFAMLEMNPSPFCILDEIDAALDEANIGRYTNYLSSFEDKIQFVMITHRKTTMEMADVLYGVTMEEEGVSRILSVELSDEEKIKDMIS